MFILEILVPIIIIISIIALFLRRGKGVAVDINQDKDWYFRVALSREDFLSQWFWLMSLLFLGITISILNRDFDSPISYPTVVAIVTVIGLFSTYYLKSVYLLTASLIGMISWWISQSVLWLGSTQAEIQMTGVALGLIIFTTGWYLLAQLHERETKFLRFYLVYTIFALLFSFGIIFVFSTQEGLDNFGFATTGLSVFNSWPTSISLLILMIGLLGLLWYNLKQKLLGYTEFIVIIALIGLFTVISSIPQQNIFVETVGSDGYFNRALSDRGVFWAIVFNVLLLLETLAMIFLGYVKQRVWLINLGVFMLSLTVIVKYFDWFFTFLDKSIFFIGAGILFFVVGWFMEKGRRKIIAQVKV